MAAWFRTRYKGACLNHSMLIRLRARTINVTITTKEQGIISDYRSRTTRGDGRQTEVTTVNDFDEPTRA